jgi:hypothetical protein
MNNTKCLNCDASLEGKFCPNCGQKADSHRITIKHFLMHDILHGVWHFENKILFTIKQSVVRPGYAAIEYIQGKRIRYYNVFYITALLLGLTLFLSHYCDIYYDKVFHIPEDHTFDKFDLVISKYQKIIALCFIPFAAINSYLLFRRVKLNFPEHIIIAGFAFLGVVVLGMLYVLLSFLEILFKTRLPDIITMAPPIIFLVLFSITYYQAFKQTGGIWWKLIVWNLLIIIEFVTIILITTLLLTGK